MQFSHLYTHFQWVELTFVNGRSVRIGPDISLWLDIRLLLNREKSILTMAVHSHCLYVSLVSSQSRYHSRCITRWPNNGITIWPSCKKQILQHLTTGRYSGPFCIQRGHNFTNEFICETPGGIKRRENVTKSHPMDRFRITPEWDAVIGINILTSSLRQYCLIQK